MVELFTCDEVDALRLSWPFFHVVLAAQLERNFHSFRAGADEESLAHQPAC